MLSEAKVSGTVAAEALLNSPFWSSAFALDGVEASVVFAFGRSAGLLPLDRAFGADVVEALLASTICFLAFVRDVLEAFDAFALGRLAEDFISGDSLGFTELESLG